MLHLNQGGGKDGPSVAQRKGTMWKKKEDLEEIDSMNSDEESDLDKVESLAVNAKGGGSAFFKKQGTTR